MSDSEDRSGYSVSSGYLRRTEPLSFVLASYTVLTLFDFRNKVKLVD